MTDLDRRVATLAAVFAPTRTSALLARLRTPGAADALAHAVRLSNAPRRDRLQALSAVLGPDRAAIRACADAIASAERRRLAKVARALAAGRPPDGVSPLVLRLVRERISR